jgi:hypothetical protein
MMTPVQCYLFEAILDNFESIISTTRAHDAFIAKETHDECTIYAVCLDDVYFKVRQSEQFGALHNKTDFWSSQKYEAMQPEDLSKMPSLCRDATPRQLCTVVDLMLANVYSNALSFDEMDWIGLNACVSYFKGMCEEFRAEFAALKRQVEAMREK